MIHRAAGVRIVSPSGFTLIELTVVLAVIVTLALVLTPSIANYVSDARGARARSDTQTIASAIVQLNRDTGFYPLWSEAQNGGPGTAASRVDLLVSRGNIPAAPQSSLWTTGTSLGLSEVLALNTPGYALRGAASAFGWNGPYLSSGIEADPWNNRYAVNVRLIDSTTGAFAADGTPKNAVWVLSPGADGSLETPFAEVTRRAVLAGDDIGFRLQ